MEINTPIAEDIQATDQNAQYDAACKRLLSERIILAWIMKSCLKEYRDCDVKEIAEKYIESEPEISKVFVAPDETNAPTKIRGIGNEDNSLTEGRITYDIRFLASVPGSGELIQMIVNIEIQGKFYPGYPVVTRGIYYGCRMISSQYGTEFTHSEYQNIKKVVSIWVCPTPPGERRNSITRYHITEENLVGDVKEPVRHYDLMDVVVLCLGGGEDGGGIFRLLGTLLSSKATVAEKRRVLQDEFDIPMTRTLETEVETMCNLSQEVMERGMEKGLIKGRAEGRAEGMVASIKNLMTNTGWTLEKAMEILGVPVTDRPKYTKLLNG